MNEDIRKKAIDLMEKQFMEYEQQRQADAITEKERAWQRTADALADFGIGQDQHNFERMPGGTIKVDDDLEFIGNYRHGYSTLRLVGECKRCGRNDVLSWQIDSWASLGRMLVDFTPDEHDCSPKTAKGEDLPPTPPPTEMELVERAIKNGAACMQYENPESLAAIAYQLEALSRLSLMSRKEVESMLLDFEIEVKDTEEE